MRRLRLAGSQLTPPVRVRCNLARSGLAYMFVAALLEQVEHRVCCCQWGADRPHLSGVAWRRTKCGLLATSCAVPSLAHARAHSAVGGIGLNKEGFVTAALKDVFHRARPSTLHHNFSFPSGHATAAYFVNALLVFALIPCVAACMRRPERGVRDDDEAGRASLLRALDWTQAPGNALRIVLACGATTQLGRVLADAHYASDTLAGACLGGAGAGAAIVMLQVSQRVVARIDKDRYE